METRKNNFLSLHFFSLHPPHLPRRLKSLQQVFQLVGEVNLPSAGRGLSVSSLVLIASSDAPGVPESLPPLRRLCPEVPPSRAREGPPEGQSFGKTHFRQVGPWTEAHAGSLQENKIIGELVITSTFSFRVFKRTSHKELKQSSAISQELWSIKLTHQVHLSLTPSFHRWGDGGLRGPTPKASATTGSSDIHFGTRLLIFSLRCVP